MRVRPYLARLKAIGLEISQSTELCADEVIFGETMTTSSHFAAQYIRMSTDKQDLSPSLQKEAIAAYAAARGMEIVASYEDEGRSGIHLKNRLALLRLLHDVTESKQFSTVLVYDVSR